MDRIGDVSRECRGELVAELLRFACSFLNVGADDATRAVVVTGAFSGESVVLAEGDVLVDSASADEDVVVGGDEDVCSEVCACPCGFIDATVPLGPVRSNDD